MCGAAPRVVSAGDSRPAREGHHHDAVNVHGTVAVMTSLATPPCSTLTARAHARLAPRPEIVQVSTEARFARPVAPLLEDVWADAP